MTGNHESKVKSVLELQDGFRGGQESHLRLSCHMMPFSSDFEMVTRRKNKLEAKMIQILGYARVLDKMNFDLLTPNEV